MIIHFKIDFFTKHSNYNLTFMWKSQIYFILFPTSFCSEMFFECYNLTSDYRTPIPLDPDKRRQYVYLNTVFDFYDLLLIF